MDRSEQLFRRAVEKIPGGVNSPVRAFLSVGGTPRFIDRAQGQYLYDVDGNQYLDYIGSWGPMILGHNHKRSCCESSGERIKFWGCHRSRSDYGRNGMRSGSICGNDSHGKFRYGGGYECHSGCERIYRQK